MDRPDPRDARRPSRLRRKLGVAIDPPSPSGNAERGAALLDDSLVGRLQAIRTYPCASVLMTTVPAARMRTRDAAKLDRLVAAAGRRMVAEAPHLVIEPVLARLHRLSEEARRQPTGWAIALYASDDHDAAVVLPIAVVDRVVIDPTFATRDLVRSLARHPRVRLVVASERHVRVLEGWSGQLTEVRLDGLASPTTGHDRGDRSRAFGREADRGRRARSAVRARRAADVVTARHRRDPLPLVLAGGRRQIAVWRKVPSIAEALIGIIPGNHDETPIAQLDELSRAAVLEHLEAERHEALARLAAEHPDHCAFGIDRVWAAAGVGGIELLCVEDGFTYTARPARGGNGLEVVEQLEHPAVLDDVVDETIELVHRSGGRVVTVRNGALAEFDSVAALLRTGT